MSDPDRSPDIPLVIGVGENLRDLLSDSAPGTVGGSIGPYGETGYRHAEPSAWDFIPTTPALEPAASAIGQAIAQVS